MNIFYLDSDPKVAAQMHCDKHIVKMIIESAQLLSTAHRVNDGTPVVALSNAGRRVTRYVLTDSREDALYKATHTNHPSALWCRASADNYAWLHRLFVNLLEEYTYRYGKEHLSTKLVEILRLSPVNIKQHPFTEPPQAMPDYCKVPGNSVIAYQNYYINEKLRFAKWTRRDVPLWLRGSTK